MIATPDMVGLAPIRHPAWTGEGRGLRLVQPLAGICAEIVWEEKEAEIEACAARRPRSTWARLADRLRVALKSETPAERLLRHELRLIDFCEDEGQARELAEQVAWEVRAEPLPGAVGCLTIAQLAAMLRPRLAANKCGLTVEQLASALAFLWDEKFGRSREFALGWRKPFRQLCQEEAEEEELEFIFSDIDQALGLRLPRGLERQWHQVSDFISHVWRHQTDGGWLPPRDDCLTAMGGLLSILRRTRHLATEPQPETSLYDLFQGEAGRLAWRHFRLAALTHFLVDLGPWSRFHRRWPVRQLAPTLRDLAQSVARANAIPAGC